MDEDELVGILLQKFPQYSYDVVRSVLAENDLRLGSAEAQLELMQSQRQGTAGASTSGGSQPSASQRERDEREAQIRRDALLARSMQAHSLRDDALRDWGGGAGPAEDDTWTETLNAVSTTINSAVNYASTFGGWASNLIANLDPTSLLFEEDDEYDGPGRPPPDTSKDKEGVSIGRSPLTRRARDAAELPPSSPPAGETTDEEEEEEEGGVVAWLGGEDDVSYRKKDS